MIVKKTLLFNSNGPINGSVEFGLFKKYIVLIYIWKFSFKNKKTLKEIFIYSKYIMNEMEKIENLKSLLNREINYRMTEIKETMDFMRTHEILSKKSINMIMHLQYVLNNVMKSLDVNISRLFGLINCNFCYSSMATNFLHMNEFFF